VLAPCPDLGRDGSIGIAMAGHPHREHSLAEARAVATYLTTIRMLVNDASASRAVWIRQIGALMKEARTADDPGALAGEAARIGTEQLATFRALRERLDKLQPPGLCQDCHVIVVGWLEKQMAACEVMVDVGQAGELAGLRATQGLLAEGRDDSRRFATTYAELVAWLRERLTAHKQHEEPRRPRIPWLRGRR
jgi:hypothetical protein